MENIGTVFIFFHVHLISIVLVERKKQDVFGAETYNNNNNAIKLLDEEIQEMALQ